MAEETTDWQDRERGDEHADGPLPDLGLIWDALPDFTRKRLEPLTNKQRDFALLITHGVEEARAYRFAYDVKPTTKETSVVANASKLRRTATIQQAVEWIEKGSVAADLMSDAPPMSKQWILERLASEARADTGNTGSVRVRALELLGRAHGLFEDVQVVKDERPQTAAEAKDRLMDILKRAGKGELVEDADFELLGDGEEDGQQPDD